MTHSKQVRNLKVIFIGPDVEPHEDPARIIGRRTTYLGEDRALRDHEVVIVAVFKDALLCPEDSPTLRSDEEIREAGGLGPNDLVEVAIYLPEEGRVHPITFDPRAVDLEIFFDLNEPSDE